MYDTWEAAQGLRILELEAEVAELKAKLSKEKVDRTRINLYTGRALNITRQARKNVLCFGGNDAKEMEGLLEMIRGVVEE